MSAPQGRLTIGAFARVTGISASALRYYHDCGLVVPGEVDPATGYRHYHPGQVDQALLVRHLRAAGLSLAEVRQLLTAPPAAVREALRNRLAAMERALRDAHANAAAALGLLRPPGPGSCAPVVVAAELAAAVRRVCRSADRDPDLAPDLAVLACVLIEARDGELTLVATDRYRLVVQSLPVSGPASPPPGRGSSPTARAVVPARALERLHPWLRRQDGIHLHFGTAPDDPGGVRLVAANDRRDLPAVPDTFPDHRLLLDNLPAPATRVLVPRQALLSAVGGSGPGPLRWDADPRHGLRVARPGTTTHRVDAEVHGTGARLGFEPARLRAVLTDSVGPDLAFEIAGPDRPVVVRSADRTGVTTLLMPTALAPEPPAHDPAGAA